MLLSLQTILYIYIYISCRNIDFKVKIYDVILKYSEKGKKKAYNSHIKKSSCVCVSFFPVLGLGINRSTAR